MVLRVGPVAAKSAVAAKTDRGTAGQALQLVRQHGRIGGQDDDDRAEFLRRVATHRQVLATPTRIA